MKSYFLLRKKKKEVKWYIKPFVKETEPTQGSNLRNT